MGSKQRYVGIAGMADYKKVVQLIKDGGYATSLTYVEKLCSIIERWNLTQYDVKETAVEPKKWYRVCVSIKNLNIRKGPGTNYDKTGKYTGIGVFTIVDESEGEGATKWGKLKSGAGWISLDFAKRI